MPKPRMLVTGATGKTGAPTALLLLQGYPVRALVHQEDARSASLMEAGAEICVGSLEDPVAVQEAVKGVQRAYFCPPLEPGSLRRAAIFAEAAQDGQLEAIVVLSQWLVDRDHLSIHAREKYLGRIFRWASDVPVITINPGWFADNYMAALEPNCAIRADGVAAWKRLECPAIQRGHRQGHCRGIDRSGALCRQSIQADGTQAAIAGRENRRCLRQGSRPEGSLSKRADIAVSEIRQIDRTFRFYPDPALFFLAGLPARFFWRWRSNRRGAGNAGLSRRILKRLSWATSSNRHSPKERWCGGPRRLGKWPARC